MKPHIHKDITSQALEAHFSRAALHLIREANEESDNLANQFNKGQHFDDCALAAGVRFVDKLDQALRSELASVPQYVGRVKEGRFIVALYALGRLLHAIQDFYSHSNWINLTGLRIRVWNESVNNPNGINRQCLKSGYFSLVAEGARLTREGRVRELIQAASPRFYDRYLTPERMTHAQLNKDEHGTLADLSFRNRHHACGFQLACQDARYHSARKWTAIADKLTQAMGSEGARSVLTELRSWRLTTMSTGRALYFGRLSLKVRGVV